jgi:hypothetical protein
MEPLVKIAILGGTIQELDHLAVFVQLELSPISLDLHFALVVMEEQVHQLKELILNHFVPFALEVILVAHHHFHVKVVQY